MDTTEKKEELQETETAGTDGNQDAADKERTFTQDDITRIIGDKLRKEREKHEKEIAELRETLTANIERAQHLEHDSYQVNQHREELEELRAYKAKREREDMLKRVSDKYDGVPTELLRGETEEELEAYAQELTAFAKGKYAPQTPEVLNEKSTWNQEAYNGLLGDVTKESITRIADRKERMKAIAEHAEEFGLSRSGFDALGEFID